MLEKIGIPDHCKFYRHQKHCMSGASKAEAICVSDETSSSDTDDVCIFIGYNEEKSHKPGYCRKCFVNLVDLMFYPCTHASICHECYDAMEGEKRCPICSAKITKHEMFFLV